jgi:D-alanine-D-alanine ligase
VRVAIVHNAVSSHESEDQRDVLEQARAVAEALESLGHQSLTLDCTLDLDQLRRRLEEVQPDIVFNLVEALGGSDWLIHLVPALLDVLNLPYTGSPTEAIFLSTQKLLAKQRLRGADLPTPAWIAPASGRHAIWLGENVAVRQLAEPPTAGPWIVKTLWEHASFAINDESLVAERPHDWEAWLEGHSQRLGRPCFAEQFIEGREFNLSLLDGLDEPQVLPSAEIDFSRFPADKPRIVGYQAKWIADSPEYHDTPRRFDFPDADQPLLASLVQLAEDAWDVFGLRGYARVDFRVDRRGQPWILEINANPCLSPDAGFAAALERAGIGYPEAIQRILDAAR